MNISTRLSLIGLIAGAITASATEFASDRPLTLKQPANPTVALAKNSNRLINPYKQMRVRKNNNLPDGTLLWESFENDSPDQSIYWLPEGWTVESDGDSALGPSEKWTNTPATDPYTPGPVDGNFYMGINFSTYNQDEWLVSPEIDLPSEQLYQLSFYAYIDPLYFYDLTSDLVDWDRAEFIRQEIICDFQVLVSADGGEFDVVRDFAEEYMGTSMYDMMLNTPSGLDKYVVDLGDYKGKKIRIAFRYVGRDGQTLFLDAVSVALPEMGLQIVAPLETLWWGFDYSNDWTYMGLSIAQYPVYAPFTFTAASTSPNVKFSWEACNPDTTEMEEAGEEDELTLEYHTDYTSEFTTRDNLYYSPILHGTAEGYTPTDTRFDADYLQAGGKAEFKFSDGSLKEFGVLPFNINTSDIGVYTIDVATLGDESLPVFGYDKSSDAYWLDYTFRGDAEAGDSSFVSSYFNYIYPASAPRVVNKIWANALGYFDGDVEFRCDIIPLVEYYEDGEFYGYVMADEPLASATCLGRDALGWTEGSVTKDYVVLGFDFVSPVLLDINQHPSYIVRISGFHDERVGYFGPVQQWKPNPDEIALGWYTKTTTMQGQTRESVQPIAYRANEYGDMYCAFSINMGGYYPWLQSEVSDVELVDNTPTEVALDSYYGAEDLIVSAPEWIKATVEGRYGTSKLILSALDSDDNEGEIVIEGLGVRKTFNVKVKGGSSVKTMLSNPKEEIRYNLNGMKADKNQIPGSITISRSSKELKL